MKYRLKDREFQEKLDAISGGDFSKRLQDPAKSEEGFAVAYGDFPEINGLRHLSLFLADEIEEVPEYDPKAWNEWPGVEPPRDVPLRLEVREPDEDLDTPEPRFGKIRKKACACFDGNDWFYWPGRSFSSYISIGKGDVVRFRPWVGPDEEAK